ncbi:hypothetical protein ACB092_01G114600 [Castanea dentata]
MSIFHINSKKDRIVDGSKLKWNFVHLHISFALWHLQKICPVVSGSSHTSHSSSCIILSFTKFLFVGRISLHALQAKWRIFCGTGIFHNNLQNLLMLLPSEEDPDLTWRGMSLANL